jgi:methionyl-tRNA formyltransferase
MVKALDAGDILFQESLAITPNETYQSLYQKLSKLAYSMLTKHLNELFNTKINSIKQDETNVTIAKNISRDDELIRFDDIAINIDCKVRAFNNVPIAYCKYNNEDIKVYECVKTGESSTKYSPGTIVNVDKNGIKIATKDNFIIFTKIQLPGKNPMFVKDLINGNHSFTIDSKFN